MNPYEKIYDMIIETNFPDDEGDRRVDAILTQGKSLQGPKLRAFGKKHAERLERTKKTGSSLLTQYLSKAVGHPLSDIRKLKGKDS